MARWRNERGAVMVLAALTLTVLLLFAGLALDFGRAHLLRAQLQSAVDAAALAGAQEAIPMVTLSVDRSVAVAETCYDPKTKLAYTCLTWESASPVVITGNERLLIGRGRWRSEIADQCGWPYRCAGVYAIVRQWLVLPASAEPVARQTFQLNAFWPSGPDGAAVDQFAVRSDAVKAEVTATARLRTGTHFLKLVGIRELTFTRTGSAVPVRR